MDYKALFHIALLLISSPARAWEEIRLETDNRHVTAGFVYPLIGLCSLSVFAGCLIGRGWSGPESFQYAMTQCCAMAVSLFGGYYLAAYLLNLVRTNVLMQDGDLARCQRFVGYSMVVTLLLRAVIGLLPDIIIVAMIGQFYTFYVVWEGADRMMEVEEPTKVRFTVIASVLILLCPVAIDMVFNKLMAVFN